MPLGSRSRLVRASRNSMNYVEFGRSGIVEPANAISSLERRGTRVQNQRSGGRVPRDAPNTAAAPGAQVQSTVEDLRVQGTLEVSVTRGVEVMEQPRQRRLVRQDAPMLSETNPVDQDKGQDQGDVIDHPSVRVHEVSQGTQQLDPPCPRDVLTGDGPTAQDMPSESESQKDNRLPEEPVQPDLHSDQASGASSPARKSGKQSKEAQDLNDMGDPNRPRVDPTRGGLDDDECQGIVVQKKRRFNVVESHRLTMLQAALEVCPFGENAGYGRKSWNAVASAANRIWNSASTVTDNIFSQRLCREWVKKDLDNVPNVLARLQAATGTSQGTSKVEDLAIQVYELKQTAEEEEAKQAEEKRKRKRALDGLLKSPNPSRDLREAELGHFWDDDDCLEPALEQNTSPITQANALPAGRQPFSTPNAILNTSGPSQDNGGHGPPSSHQVLPKRPKRPSKTNRSMQKDLADYMDESLRIQQMQIHAQNLSREAMEQHELRKLQLRQDELALQRAKLEHDSKRLSKMADEVNSLGQAMNDVQASLTEMQSISQDMGAKMDSLLDMRATMDSLLVFLKGKKGN